MSTAKKEKLDRVRESIRAFQEHERELAEELGESSQSTTPVTERQSEQAKLAEAFDQMTSAERTEMYLQDRDGWDRMVAAKESEGMRKLLSR